MAALLTRRRLRLVAALALVLLLLWLFSSVAFAYRLTRRPHAPFAEPAPAVPGGETEAVRLGTADGEEIGAWFIPGPQRGPAVLLLHGNGKSRRASLPLAEMLAREGCSVLAVSLRAHGDSSGEFNDLGYSARHDVTAAVGYLERRCPGQPVVVQGTSLGAAAAIYAAADLGGRVSGYVLECPYRDVRTAVRNWTAAYLPFPLGRVAYAGLISVGPLFLPPLDQMAPVERIADIPPNVPVLLLAGGRDNRARPEEVEALQRRVASHARLVVFQEAGHGAYSVCSPARYREVVLGFLGAAAKREPGARRPADQPTAPDRAGMRASPLR